MSVGIYDGIKTLTPVKTFKISILNTGSISAGDTTLIAIHLHRPTLLSCSTLKLINTRHELMMLTVYRQSKTMSGLVPVRF
ncbi:hypothetical protein [uncultured Pantoea sp.]|uniref:hypothetical protein n=1 Tax=uncultured Pantoea sp. TaxID=218084 RepID=UPI0025F1BF80|nr:hypothetical protein [uncultured Pantoea sp.]